MRRGEGLKARDVHVKFHDDEYLVLAKMATAEDRSLPNLVRVLVAEALKARDAKRV